MDLIKNITPNKYFAKIFQNLYAGTDGEIFCLMQFFFQKQALAPFNTPLFEPLQKIFLQNLHHAEILSEIITLLGQKPTFQNSNGMFLSLRNISTETNQQNILLVDIQLLEKLLINYNSSKLKISNTFLKKILSKIITEKELQLNLLKSLQNCLKSAKI